MGSAPAMSEPAPATGAHLSWADTAADAGALKVCGDCTMPQVPVLLAEICRLKSVPTMLDLAEIVELDSAGALVLLRLLDPKLGPNASAKTKDAAEANAGANYAQALAKFQNVPAPQQSLLTLIAEHASTSKPVPEQAKGFVAWVTRIGEIVQGLWTQALALIAFFGAIFHCFWAIMAGKRKLRMTSVVHHIERTGLDAVPIVGLLCFIFGAVVAYLSASAMKNFGAGIFTVDIVSVSFLREFGVLLTSILVAGRSGSAFTAEIGSMNTREEIDAIKALSLDPIELLVIPRVCALIVTLPMLSFLAVLAGIFGGALVGATSLDISVSMFLTRMQDNTELYYLWLGLLKAPVFAFIIAAIGCLEGLKVSGSAESVGLHTTSSVVQSIFLVIVVDALFAVLFMQLDL